MKLAFALLFALGTVGFVSRAYAADPPPADKKADKKDAKNVRGEVVKVDGNKVTIKTKDKEVVASHACRT